MYLHLSAFTSPTSAKLPIRRHSFPPKATLCRPELTTTIRTTGYEHRLAGLLTVRTSVLRTNIPAPGLVTETAASSEGQPQHHRTSHSSTIQTPSVKRTAPSKRRAKYPPATNNRQTDHLHPISYPPVPPLQSTISVLPSTLIPTTSPPYHDQHASPQPNPTPPSCRLQNLHSRTLHLPLPPLHKPHSRQRSPTSRSLKTNHGHHVARLGPGSRYVLD